MSKQRDYNGCTTGAEFIREARKAPGLRAERWAGSHWNGYGPAGRVTIANHNRELPGGLRRRIAAGLIAAGIVAIPFVCFVANLASGLPQ